MIVHHRNVLLLLIAVNLVSNCCTGFTPIPLSISSTSTSTSLAKATNQFKIPLHNLSKQHHDNGRGRIPSLSMSIHRTITNNERSSVRSTRSTSRNTLSSLHMASSASSGDRPLDDIIKKSGTAIVTSDETKPESSRSHQNHNKQKSRPHGHGHGQPHKTHKVKMNHKKRVRTMFRQAKDMERTGQWRQACIHLEKILELDPHDSYSHLALARLESRREKTMTTASMPGGKVNENVNVNQNRSHPSNGDKQIKTDSSLEDTDADITDTDSQLMQEITPSKISQTQPFSKAREAFFRGTEMCPTSVHIWQAWALYEDTLGNTSFARSLFQHALQLDQTNPYVCHGYGLLEHKCGNYSLARELWSRPLKTKQKGKVTAAIVCSLGKLMVAQGEFEEARTLYMESVLNIDSQREVTEVYLAAAWLEEQRFHDLFKAEEMLKLALLESPGNSRVLAALARMEGRKVDSQRLEIENGRGADVKSRRNDAVKKELRDACRKLVKEHKKDGSRRKSDVKDGRLFNAWAKLEVKDKNFDNARNILKKGMELFPHDHSLRQAAGKVEERVGNYSGARDWYSESLLITPSSPTLVAYAMLEISHPIENELNYTKVARLFDEALLLDPRHGPVYNAYGNMELKMGNVEKARQIYQNGVFANCRDMASVYHGLAMLELSLGNIETARVILMKGLKEVRRNDSGMDTNRRKRAIFLAQSLGMLELNCNRAAEAKVIFEKGIGQHGNSSQLLLGAALSEVKLGNEDAARALFERAVVVDRKHAQAWQSWGVMEMRAGNYKIAKTLFECGIKNDHRHGALWQAYATMESRGGNIESARALFAAGVVKCPKHVPLYQAWACLELRSKNYDKARTLIGEALTRKCDQGSSWLVAAKIEESSGNEGLAGLILKRGIKNAPDCAKLYCSLAEYEIGLGKIDVARDLLQKGLEIDPFHAPLYHSLAELEARVFNIEGLARLNKKAAELFNTNATQPAAPTTMKMLGNKLRMSSHSRRKLPTNVASVADLISVDLDIDEAISDMDPDMLIENLGKSDDDDIDDLDYLER